MPRNTNPSYCFLMLICFCIFLSLDASAQNNEVDNVITENNAMQPCISAYQYQLLEHNILENRKMLDLDTPNPNSREMSSTSLAWPLKASSALHDCSYYRIAAYVDQNTASSVFQDYNCGTLTYDGHGGTDISTWPLNFYKMDSNYVEVVAAAPGIIIDKHDGEYDRNCVGVGSGLVANYVMIQHTDGSVALYWHMKNGMVTTKAIGASVILGEKLGIVGSSGSSSGPHLHFEVWNGSTSASRIDPYSGTCNLLNSTSWWTSQKAYKETSVVKVSVNTTDLNIPPCPASEIPNESDYYNIPFSGAGLAPGYAKFYLFLREELNGLTANMSINNPDATPYLSWTYNSTADNRSKIFGWSKLLPTNDGVYTFVASYNGTSCSTSFRVDNSTIVNEIPNTSTISLYPNPSDGLINIELSEDANNEIEIYNVLGTKIFEASLQEKKSTIIFDGQKGIYFYKILHNNQFIFSGKLLIQ